jgi:hypothetical protein
MSNIEKAIAEIKHRVKEETRKEIEQIIREYFETSTMPVADPSILNGYIRENLRLAE